MTAAARRLAASCTMAILAMAAATSTAASAAPVTPGPGDLIVEAHRGSPTLGAPPNSLALFQKAVAEPTVDRIETDVRWTKDQVLVLIHDAALPDDCTSPGLRVHDMTWAALARVRCAGEPIPQLKDLLDLVRGTSIDLNIELKKDSGQSGAGLRSFADKVASTVDASGLPADQAGFSTFYWRDYARTISARAKGRVLTAFESDALSTPTQNMYSAVRLARDLGATGFTTNAAFGNEQLADYIAGPGRMVPGYLYLKDDDQVRFALAHRSWSFGSEDPARTRRHLDSLVADLAATPLALRHTTTTVASRALLSRKSLKKNTNTFVKTLGAKGLLPSSAITQMDGIRFTVTVTGRGSGTVELAPASSRYGIDGTRVAVPKGTKTYTMYASPGDGGKVRVRATGAATVSVTMTGFRTAWY